MKEYFVDLHVHIGRSSKGKAFESYTRKGLHMSLKILKSLWTEESS